MLIRRVYIPGSQKKNKFINKFINTYPQIEKIEYYQNSDFNNLIQKLNSEIDYDNSQTTIVFKEHLSNFIKRCPCSQNVKSCGYYVINIIQNCFLGCSYCYLRLYVNNNLILINCNLEKLEIELAELSKKKKEIRLGSGEFSDSLLFDKFTGITEYIINQTQNYKNILFEIKTKTAEIQHLLDNSADIHHKQNLIFSWSLNPQTLIDTEEKFTATLKDRLRAAQTAIDFGFNVAFHFDPIIYFKDWQNEYLKTIELLFSKIKAEKIKWISIGAFRCAPDLLPLIRFSTPNSKVFLGEFIRGKDNKVRYLLSLRKQMFEFIISNIRTHLKNNAQTPKIYLCMENQELWNEFKCSI